MSGAVARPAATGASFTSGDWTTVGWVTGAASDRSVVRITARRCGDEIRGSGVIVDGRVLTNRHVVEGARALVLTTSDGEAHDVTNIETSGGLDLARLNAPGLTDGVALATSAPPVDSTVRLAGFPGGREFVAREATVVDLVRGVVPVDPPVATHLDVTVVPGESGSALIDSDGLLAGLLYAKATADGGGLAIDAVRVRLGLATLEPKSFASC